MRHVRFPRAPCVSASHSPAPKTFSPVASITTCTGLPPACARASAVASTSPGLRRENVVWSGMPSSRPSKAAIDRSRPSVGRHGRPFRIFKFRTMTVAPPSGGVPLTVAGDRRITRIGALLRRTKLDELAQLIDVLRGTMSLVGPRPEVPRYVAHYPAEWRERLLSVRPGITDFASVRYRDENELLAQADDPEREYIDVILPTKLRYALHYVDRPSLANDLRVLGLTLRTVFRLALRQTEGLIGSVVGLLGLALRVPDHTTPCRQAATLEVA